MFRRWFVPRVLIACFAIMITGLLFGGPLASTDGVAGAQVSQAVIAPEIGAITGFSEDAAVPLAEETGAASAQGTQFVFAATTGEAAATAPDGAESSVPRYSTAGTPVTS